MRYPAICLLFIIGIFIGGCGKIVAPGATFKPGEYKGHGVDLMLQPNGTYTVVYALGRTDGGTWSGASTSTISFQSKFIQENSPSDYACTTTIQGSVLTVTCDAAPWAQPNSALQLNMQ